MSKGSISPSARVWNTLGALEPAPGRGLSGPSVVWRTSTFPPLCPHTGTPHSFFSSPLTTPSTQTCSRAQVADRTGTACKPQSVQTWAATKVAPNAFLEVTQECGICGVHHSLRKGTGLAVDGSRGARRAVPGGKHAEHVSNSSSAKPQQALTIFFFFNPGPQALGILRKTKLSISYGINSLGRNCF